MISRRDFLLTATAGTILAPVLTAAQNLSANEKLLAQTPEYPLAKAVETFRQRQKTIPSFFRPTRLDKREYLRLIEGIVKYFAAFQDSRGAIIDPYEKRERQYSTPAFACSAACLYASGYNKSFLPHCIKAMDAATSDLMLGKTADNHSNFYTILLMQAYDFLQNKVSSSDLARWRENLSKIIPEKIYRLKTTAESNWNMVAASGEWRRKQAGMTANLDWMNQVLDTQMKFWTAHGLYRDPHDPLAYDHFARYHALDMLINKYQGVHAKMMRELVDRAAWTSLFMQSPHGELPTGGRSAHHQWNEAEQAFTYEIYAAQFAEKGDKQIAGAFKRAARLALRSIGKWRKSFGDLWIVKNRYDSAQRFGYETYSFHSQYNLLTAAKLAAAYFHADDKIKELPAPSEIGGFVFELKPAFHKVFANAGGMYLEIETRADAAYNPTGLLRVHHPQVNPQLTVSDGVTPKPGYQLPTKPTRALAIGAAWRDFSGNWHSLAEHDEKVLRDAEIKVLQENTNRVEFEIKYQGQFRGGATAVRQQFIVTPSRIEISETVEGDIDAVRVYFPLFLTDGQNDTKIEVSDKKASVALSSGEAQVYEILEENGSLTRLNISEPSRNGMFDAACFEKSGRAIKYAIQPRPAQI